VVGGAAIVTGIAITATALLAGDKLGEALDEGYRGGRDLVTGVFAAVSGKILEVRLAGQANNIATHFGKLGNPNEPGGNDPKWRDKWKRDIQKGIREMKKLADRLKGKDQEKWLERIKATEDQLSNTK
jgi:hypothetical protein